MRVTTRARPPITSSSRLKTLHTGRVRCERPLESCPAPCTANLFACSLAAGFGCGLSSFLLSGGLRRGAWLVCFSVESVKAICFVKSSACRRVLLGVIARLGVLDGLILRAGRGRGVSERCGAARREVAAKLFRGGTFYSAAADGGGFQAWQMVAVLRTSS